ncbi:MAG: bifunctional phosphopantothenoylcysteine decarboxylase/phosphopantothenate--cysteine ligase CoaBC [Rickettsiales bacterium]|nr:bifunctional phosphopantothenoylcysteine decarboxylase/phosphopantothenate--cysteine ligase CoaBC [Rickettsiales bacterium]
MAKHKILLVISGSIAAYKALELIRRGREIGYQFTCVITSGGQQFVTPLSCASLSENPCYTDLFSLKDETEMGHIRLSRESDAIMVIPASADFLAKMANGTCDDLASTILMATNKPVLVAPAMNHKMWEHPATKRHCEALKDQGVEFIEPSEGTLACGEEGAGRMADVPDILAYMEKFFSNNTPLSGYHAVVTAGPTYEAIDPVRFIGNRSSGKQGYAIAEALAYAGANVTLISGPTSLQLPEKVELVEVESADQMLKACEEALPADIGICTAAVADWRAEEQSDEKIKKSDSKKAPAINLTENPDILHTLAKHDKRPELLIGFAAETVNVVANAKEKLMRKGCDWIVANDVSGGRTFGEDDNEVTLITRDTQETLPLMSKEAVAKALIERVVIHLRPETKAHKLTSLSKQTDEEKESKHG